MAKRKIENLNQKSKQKRVIWNDFTKCYKSKAFLLSSFDNFRIYIIYKLWNWPELSRWKKIQSGLSNSLSLVYRNHIYIPFIFADVKCYSFFTFLSSAHTHPTFLNSALFRIFIIGVHIYINQMVPFCLAPSWYFLFGSTPSLMVLGSAPLLFNSVFGLVNASNHSVSFYLGPNKINWLRLRCQFRVLVGYCIQSHCPPLILAHTILIGYPLYIPCLAHFSHLFLHLTPPTTPFISKLLLGSAHSPYFFPSNFGRCCCCSCGGGCCRGGLGTFVATGDWGWEFCGLTCTIGASFATPSAIRRYSISGYHIVLIRSFSVKSITGLICSLAPPMND